MAISKRAPIVDRLVDRIVVTDSGCWQYLGATDSNGYGLIGYLGKSHRVHRLVYELIVGPIPAGLVSDHVCHNVDDACNGGRCAHRRCCNPFHLALVAPAVNSGSGRQGRPQARRTHCPAGHAYAEFGRRYPSGQGRRECAECKRLRSARFDAQRRADRKAVTA